MGNSIFRTLGIALALWGVLAPCRGSAANPMRTAPPIVTLQMKAEQMLDSIHRMPPPEGAQKQDISGFAKQQLPPRMGLLNVKAAFEDIPPCGYPDRLTVCWWFATKEDAGCGPAPMSW